MPAGMIEQVRRANRTHGAEDSVELRAAVLGAVLTATVALVVEEAVSGPTGMVAAVVMSVAYWVSYRRRNSDNWQIKIVLAVLALAALARFFARVGGISTLDEARFPLAEVFLWVQVLHSFDLPARRDLYFSLGSSVALMAVAGSISQDLSYGPILAVYSWLALTALVLAHRSESFQGASAVARSRHGVGALRDALWAWTAVVAVGALLFLVIPQPTSARTFALPFSLGPLGGSQTSGPIVNPGFSEEASTRSSGASYFGLADRMDLRVRGDLSDALVMRVRASAPAMWRGAIFDSYDGAVWRGDSSEPAPLPGDAPYGYPPELRGLGPRAPVTQTFYLETEQPNTIFAANQPEQLWFSGSVGVDQLGALETSSTLTEGTVYSVVSTRGAATAEELRHAPEEDVPEQLRRYLQLPDSLPERVRELAGHITRGATNDYDRVRAIERYLRDNFRYAIDSPVPPPGRDAVDHFLFAARVGFCEQFASATAVMLRTLGIPARVVSGYAVGRRNVFTGYYEVRASDAHAWVEAWFPHLGWYEFDPTFAVPPAAGGLGRHVPLVKLVRFLAERASAVLADGAGDVVRTGLGLIAVGVVAWALHVVRSRLRRRDAGAAPSTLAAPRGPVARAFARWEHALAAHGAGRAPPETARELVRRAADLRQPRVRGALEALEREGYGADPPTAPEAAAAAEELDRLTAATRRRPSP
jgi:transglutaminase-like putative cysteine protease